MVHSGSEGAFGPEHERPFGREGDFRPPTNHTDHPDEFGVEPSPGQDEPREEASTPASAEGGAPPPPPSDRDTTGFGDPEDEEPGDEESAANPRGAAIPAPRRPKPDESTSDDRTAELDDDVLGFGALDAVLDDGETAVAGTDEDDDSGIIDPDTIDDVFDLIRQADDQPYGEGAEDLIASAPRPSSAPQSHKIVPTQRTDNPADVITNRTARPGIEHSEDPTIEIPTLVAPYHEIWKARHGEIRTFRFDDRPSVTVLTHSNTRWTGATLNVSGPKLNFVTGQDDIVIVHYPDENGRIRTDHYDVFQGTEGLPEGFTVSDARIETDSSTAERAPDPEAFTERMTPNNPLLAAIMNAIPHRREDASLAGSIVYTSKTEAGHYLLVSPGKEEKIRLVTLDGRLITTERDAIIREYVTSELEPQPRLAFRTTAQALAEGQVPGYFSP